MISLRRRKGFEARRCGKVSAARDSQPPERIFEKLPPEGEYTFKLPSDEPTAEHPSRRAEGEGIMHEVFHRGSSFHLAEVVLVMPETVGTETLLVHEQVRLPDMGDLGHPADRDPKQRPDRVRDDHPWNHPGRRLGDNFDPEGRRR